MRKCIFSFLLFLLFIPELCFSQAKEIQEKPKEESYRASFGFGVGPSFPFGSFLENDIGLIEGGYAQTGISLNLDFTYRIYKSFILTALYSRTRNSYDEGTLLDNGSSSWPALSPPFTLLSVNASDYELNSFMIGYGFIKELPNYSFQFQMMVGSANMYTPDIQIERRIQNQIEIATLQAKSERDIVYSVGGILKIHLNDRLDFNTLANFTLFQSAFQQEFTSNGPVVSEEVTLRYQVFNLSFGLAYRLIPKIDESKDQLRY